MMFLFSGYSSAPRQGSGRVPEGDRLPDSAHGRRVRELLHEGSDAHSDQRVRLARRGDEEDCVEGERRGRILS